MTAPELINVPVYGRLTDGSIFGFHACAESWEQAIENVKHAFIEQAEELPRVVLAAIPGGRQ